MQPKTLGIDLNIHHSDVRKLTVKLFGAQIRQNQWDMDDIIQAVHVAILIRNNGKCPYDPKKSAMGTYLYRIIHQVILNLHRAETGKGRPPTTSCSDLTASQIREYERFQGQVVGFNPHSTLPPEG